MKSGNEQVLAMAGLGQPKVNKALKMPKGFGVVDVVFAEFHAKWRDEMKRRLVSDEGAKVVALEWQRALRRFDSKAVHDAVRTCKAIRSLPPELDSFVKAVEFELEKRNRPVPKADRQLGKSALSQIRQQLQEAS